MRIDVIHIIKKTRWIWRQEGLVGALLCGTRCALEAVQQAWGGLHSCRLNNKIKLYYNKLQINLPERK